MQASRERKKPIVSQVFYSVYSCQIQVTLAVSKGLCEHISSTFIFGSASSDKIRLASSLQMVSSEHFLNFPLVGICLLLKRNVVLRHVNRLTPPKYSLPLLIFRKFSLAQRSSPLSRFIAKKVILTVKQLKSVFALVGRFAEESHSGIQVGITESLVVTVFLSVEIS